MTATGTEKEEYKKLREHLLKAHPELGEDTARTYAGKIRGALGDAVFSAEWSPEPGAPKERLLPKGLGCTLLTLPEEYRNKVLEWWKTGGCDACRSLRTYMKYWLEWRGLEYKPEVKRAEWREGLQAPPHGVRLRTILKAFSGGAKGEDFNGACDHLLRALTGDKEYVFDDNDLKENLERFSKLRGVLTERAGFGDGPEAKREAAAKKTAAALIAEYGGGLTASFRAAAVAVWKDCCAGITGDLAVRGVSWDDSLLPGLEAMYAAKCADGAAAAFLSFTAAALRDCGAPERAASERAEPGAALRDPRLWSMSLLWNWLAAPDAESAAEVLPFLPMPEKAADCRRLADALEKIPLRARDSRETVSRLAAALLSAFRRGAALPDGGGDRAERLAAWGSARRALKAAAERREALAWAALDSGFAPAWREQVQAWELVGKNAEETAYFASLLEWEAVVCLRCASFAAAPTERGLWYERAAGALFRGETALENRLADLGAPAAARLAELYVREAELHAELARSENSETDPEGTAELYAGPADRALARARQLVKDFGGKCMDGVGAQIGAADARCAGAFSGAAAPAVRRSAGPDGRAPAALGGTFSADVFDSVRGRRKGQDAEIENVSIQMLLSGRTLVLQPSSCLDNYAFLKLMASEEGLRRLCRTGRIVMFTHGAVHSAKEYFLSVMNSGKFAFSSTGLYDVPGAWDAMRRYVAGDIAWAGAAGSFPGAWKEEAELLAAAYRFALESFPPSALGRYHQPDSAGTAPAAKLSDAVRARILRLKENDAAAGGKRAALLGSLGALAERCAGIADRSEYYDVIGGLRDGAYRPKSAGAARLLSGDGGRELAALAGEPGSPERSKLLDKLNSIVDDSYFIMNGGRASREIVLTEKDRDLRLTGGRRNSPFAVVDAGGGDSTFLLGQSAHKSERGDVEWSNICELLLAVDDVLAQSAAQPPQVRAERLERETGATYKCSGDVCLADGFSANTAAGGVRKIAPDAGKTAGQLEIGRRG